KNKYAFRNLTDFDFSWVITGDGEIVKFGRFEIINALPGETISAKFDSEINAEVGVEYFVNVKATLKSQDGLLVPGTTLAQEQFKLPASNPVKQQDLAGLPALTVNDNNGAVLIEGNGFKVEFDKT